MSTASVGVDPDMVEASAFAWLAYMRLQARPVRVTTGAAGKAVILGAVYRPTPES
jgi:1,6-anhydro-N-acetylmuramate kinase